jgi:hypothetical protein
MKTAYDSEHSMLIVAARITEDGTLDLRIETTSDDMFQLIVIGSILHGIQAERTIDTKEILTLLRKIIDKS